MKDYLQLNIKCPACGKSFMDSSHLLNGAPSVRTSVVVQGKKGILHLSSLYGSYDIHSDLTIPEGEIADFYCPECHSALKSSYACDSCQAPLVRFHLHEGGRINICSRKGCKKHFLEFQDEITALTRLYDTYSIGSGFTDNKPPRKKTAPSAKEIEDNKVEIINNGAFLQSYCPMCRKSLIEPAGIHFRIISSEGKRGNLYLSPFLNVFTHESTITLPDREKVKDISCPHCEESLIYSAKNCDDCQSPVAAITVSAMRKLITFFICTRKGCHWHGISDEDTHLIALQDSMEW